jgi:hypothetical protein
VKLDGTVTISMPISSDTRAEDFVEITITDSGSDLEFVTARMTAVQFMEAVRSLGNRPAQVEVRRLEDVGKIRELEDIQVLLGVPVWEKITPEILARAIAPWEVDGWSVHVDRLDNSRYRSGLYFRTHRSRFVDRPPTPPAEG